MPRLVRRAPLSERIKAYLDPYDFLLWLSEELNDDSYEEALHTWSIPIGIVLNVLFVLCKSTSKPHTGGKDDVFGDTGGRRSSGWFNWLVSGSGATTTYSHRQYLVSDRDIIDIPHSPIAHRFELFERSLYLPPCPTLSPVRAGDRRPSTDSLRTSRACRQHTRIAISLPIFERSARKCCQRPGVP